MDRSVLIGLVGAFGAVIATMLLEGGNPISFVNISALTLIVGGTIATGMTSYGLEEVVKIPAYLQKILFPPKLDDRALIESLITFAEKARREGILSLESDVEDINDEILKTGTQLIVDGTEPETVHEVLESLAMTMKREEIIGPEFFETCAGFSPTLGIVGTVMGLVHVLEGLGESASMSSLGRGIAVAFIATFYGIGFANLFWLPIGNRLKKMNHAAEERREMIITGVLAIQSGSNPEVVRQKLICGIVDTKLRKELRASNESK